jgi:predicted dehydrogenase
VASKSNIPDTQTATFEFDGVNVVWQHRTWGHPADPDYPWGATFYGDRGTLKASVHGWDFIPREGEPVRQEVRYELDEFPEDRTERDLERHVAPALRRHMQDFLHAVTTRGRPVADIGEGHISSASCFLANLALAVGRTLTWDAEREQVVGDEEANRLLRRPYRSPWVHPGEGRYG